MGFITEEGVEYLNKNVNSPVSMMNCYLRLCRNYKYTKFYSDKLS